MTRTCLQAVTELQKDFAHIVEWQAPVQSDGMNDALQGPVKNDWLRGGDGAAAGMEQRET